MKNLATLSFRAAAGVALLATNAHAAGGIRKEPVRFEKGASQAAIKARIQGDETVDYILRAGAGQTLAVALKKTNPQNYFNVLPPGTQEVAMFGGDSGADFKGMLPTDGDYTPGRSPHRQAGHRRAVRDPRRTGHRRLSLAREPGRIDLRGVSSFAPCPRTQSS
jgi:hypothetical protein